jgi:hypothetical protein
MIFLLHDLAVYMHYNRNVACHHTHPNLLGWCDRSFKFVHCLDLQEFCSISHEILNWNIHHLNHQILLMGVLLQRCINNMNKVLMTIKLQKNLSKLDPNHHCFIYWPIACWLWMHVNYDLCRCSSLFVRGLWKSIVCWVDNLIATSYVQNWIS